MRYRTRTDSSPPWVSSPNNTPSSFFLRASRSIPKLHALSTREGLPWVGLESDVSAEKGNGAGRNGPSGKVTKEKKKGNQPGPWIRNGENREGVGVCYGSGQPVESSRSWAFLFLVLLRMSLREESGRKEDGVTQPLNKVWLMVDSENIIRQPPQTWIWRILL